MRNKITALTLALLMLVSTAFADGFSIKIHAGLRDMTFDAGIRAGRLADGSARCDVLADGLGVYSAIISDEEGVLLQQGAGAPWQRITVFGVPVSFGSPQQISVSEQDAVKVAGGLWADLQVMYARAVEVTDGLDDSTASELISLIRELLRTGTARVTGDGLNRAVSGMLQLYLDALLPGASVTVSEGHMTLSLPAAMPSTLESLSQSELYSQLWQQLIPAEGLTVTLPVLPDFELLLEGTVTTGNLTLTAEDLLISFGYQTDLTALGYQIHMDVDVAGFTFSFSGTAGVSGLNGRAVCGGRAVDLRMVFGESGSCTVTVSDTASGTVTGNVYASFTQGGVNVSATAFGLLAALSVTHGDERADLNLTVKEQSAGLLSAPLIHLAAALDPNMLTVNLATPGSNGSLIATRYADRSSLTFSHYETATARTMSGRADLVIQPGQIVLTGDITLPDDAPLAVSATVYTSERYGLETNISRNGDTRKISCMLMQPAQNTWQLVLQDHAAGTENVTRSIIAAYSEWNGVSKLDLTADDSSDELEPFTAGLSSRVDGDTGALVLTMESGTLSAELWITPDVNGCGVKLTAVNGETELMTGTASFSTMHEGRWELEGTCLLYGEVPGELSAVLDPAAQLPEPDYSAGIGTLELFGALR